MSTVGSNPTTSVKSMIDNILKDYFFYDFIYSCEVSLDLKDFTKQCKEMRETDPVSVRHSNEGGWQSKSYNSDQETKLSRHIDILGKATYDLVEYICERENIDLTFKDFQWWLNINERNCFNHYHTHVNQELVGVFYCKVPENSGNLLFKRTDASAFNLLFAKTPAGSNFSIRPLEGRLYIFPASVLHGVSLSHSDEERISIALNIQLE